jgi:GNAT superfamily N-acetyltransferase
MTFDSAPPGDPQPGTRIREVRYDGAEAGLLLAEVQHGYVELYGGPDDTPMQAGEFHPPGGAFLIANLDGEPAGCAGLRRHDPQTAELKRMYVRPGSRRRGLARTLLRAAEDRARELGYLRLILETSVSQPEAVALYQQDGYLSTENYGWYRDSPNTRSFVKKL